MRFSVKKRRRGVRMLAMALASVFGVTLLLNSFFLTVSAYRSLSHIETIKQTESVFTILEIVPQAGTGSVGYYAKGQEPTSSWLSQVSKISPSEDTTGPAARKLWADTLFEHMMACGILSSGNATPLTSTAAYAEVFPWNVGTSDDKTPLYLLDEGGHSRRESTRVRGTFQYQGVDNASFDQLSAPTLVQEGQTGTHVQHILRVSYATEHADGFYYYNPTFEAVDLGKIDSCEGEALYVSLSPDNTGNPTYGSPSPTEIKRYAGTLGQDGFAADLKQEYYCITGTGRPSPLWSMQTPYCAQADGFAEENPGYFNMEVEGYSFLGAGKGNYSFLPSESAQQVTIWYDHVYVSGGYRNNSWFLAHVFDEQNAQLAIRVYSVVPGETEPASLSNMLEKADLIVLSAGFDLASQGASMAGLYAGSNDLSEEQADMVRQAVRQGRPVLLDGRLRAGSTHLNQLASELMGVSTSSFVQDSLYCFLPDASGGLRRALATADFALPFETGYAASGDAYYPVMAEITYENFLRSQAGGAQALPGSVTMANCIRYIVNYSGQRVQNVKDEIHILELQPNANASRLIKVPNSASPDYNSPYNVFRWLPKDTFDSVDDVQINTMSTSEFIGKIEDINETYDLVYIGDSTAGFHLSGGRPDYIDPDLDGLLYTNIGDRYNCNQRLTGLLDRDYLSDGDVSTSASRSYRFSGNDITQKKQTELKNFAASGFPVVLADSLVNTGSSATSDVELTAQVTAASKDGGVVLTASPKLSGAVFGATYLYQWYRGTPNDALRVAIAGATSPTYLPTTPDNYYCEIILQVDGSSHGVYSSYVSVQRNGWQVSPPEGGIKSSSFYPVYIDKDSFLDSSYYYVDVFGGTASNFQWYSRSRSNGAWTSVSDSNSNVCFFNGSDYYLCRVTINGNHYYSQQIRKSRDNYQKSDVTGAYATSKATLSLDVAYNITANGVLFTAKPSVSPAALSGAMPVNWFGPDGAYLTAQATTPAVTQGAYFCSVTTKTGGRVQSGAYTVSPGLKADVMTGATTRTIPGKSAVASAINNSRVDNSSILYAALSEILPRQNVMPALEAMEQRETVLKYLNLSKPRIVFEFKPKEYDGDRTTNLVGGQTLSYSFQILNPTDSTPTSTRYRCRLYLDQNADGRYVEDEELTDLTITADGKRVEENALAVSTASGSVTYTVKRTLPDSFSGIIPWKLEVVKVGHEQIHASQRGYTYIKPEMQTLHILQISSYSGGSGDRFSLEAQNADATSRYGQLFQELRNDGVYDIQITSRSVSQLNGSNWTLNAAEAAFDFNGNGWLDTQTELYGYMNSFNMLIIGFGDGYGYKETENGLSETVAKAVVSYIAGNKAVLFTHDTTSYVNLPERYDNNTVYQGQWYWGYYFNSVVRSAVGLDRFGVTDPIYGVTKYSPVNTKTGSGPVASAYAGFDLELANALLEKGYSVAYEPDSGCADTVLETQGFTTLTMLRYSNDRKQQTPLSTLSAPDSESGTTVTTVSQVNRGQITTFPYDLNDRELTVSTTHEQYYQLNMNSDDIVVWYCLSGSRFDTMKNDVINNYYIYNRGNVTYSGAGHQPTSVTTQEAQLFVNTMIAAYRAGATAPTVSFTSSNGTASDSFFLSAEYTSPQAGDYSGRLLVGEGQSEERALYFILNDPNLASGKTTSVEFYCQAADGDDVAIGQELVKATKLRDLQIYQMDETGAARAVANSGLRSGVLYKIYLPNQLLNQFGGSKDASMKLYIRAVTTIHGTQYIGANVLTLRKLGLLSLC